LARTVDFYGLQDVQTVSGAHPASCLMRIGDYFPGGEAERAWSCTSLPPMCLRGVYKDICTVYPVVLLKGKAIPLQAWTGHEGSRRMRLQDLKAIGT